MLYVKFFVTFGFLLLAAETALSQVKNPPAFIPSENKPLDFKDVIIKKLIIKLNEALRKCSQQEQLPPQQQQQQQQQPPVVPQQAIHQRPEPHNIPPAHAMIQQQKVIQHQKQIIPESRHMVQQQSIPQIMPQQILHQPQEVREVRPLPVANIQFAQEFPCHQQRFGNENNYDYEEVQCPCCECGGNCRDIQCPCCQDVQYDDVACPCCERQQSFVEGPFNGVPYAEIQSVVNNPRPQFRPQPPRTFPLQFQQEFPQQNFNPIGLQEQRIITTGPIFKETFVPTLFSPPCEAISGPNLNQPGPITQLPPKHNPREIQRPIPQRPAQQIKLPQIPQEPPPIPQQQPQQAFVVPGQVQVEQTILPDPLHPLFFTGFTPQQEKTIDKPFEPNFAGNAQFQKFIQASQNDNC